MKHIPIFPTLLVLAAVAIMILLGVWQLDRRIEKEAMIALVSANPARPAVAFPILPPVEPALLFRKSSIHCLRVAVWNEEAGRATDGSVGFRQIAQCATGAEGPGVLVNMGIAPRPGQPPRWDGGQVAGWVSEEPDHRALLSRLFEKPRPLRPMLIARDPAPGLKASAPPNVADIPNNHLAYAVQWFLFAAIALVIYGIAVWKRRQKPSQTP